MNRTDLTKKLNTITSELLREKGYISFADLFIKLNYLTPTDLEDWRRRKIPFLEKAIKTNLGKISFIMTTVRKNSVKGNLKPSKTVYNAWGKGPKQKLRFSKSGTPHIEELYSTHYLSNRAHQQTKENNHNEKPDQISNHHSGD